MSSKRYGMMREVEYDLLDKVLDRIKARWGKLSFLEVGVCGGGTCRGMYAAAAARSMPIEAAGVDFEMYRPNPTPHPDYKFYAGDSMDAWRQIPTDSQFNLLLVDACHCTVHSMCDFLNYSPFVVIGGYVVFHDTALPKGKESQEHWPQNHGYAGQPDSYLGVREGLVKLGLLQGYRKDWQLVEEVESNTGLMGMCLFRKVGVAA